MKGLKKMKIINILFLVFLLTAFAIGISMTETEMPVINQALDNATIIATNFTFDTATNNTYANGVLLVTEKFFHFITVAVVEVMRIGILFGHNNPDYFTPEFIIGIARLIVWAMILSLLIVPIMWAAAFLIILVIWIKNKFKTRGEYNESR